MLKILFIQLLNLSWTKTIKIRIGFWFINLIGYGITTTLDNTKSVVTWLTKLELQTTQRKASCFDVEWSTFLTSVSTLLLDRGASSFKSLSIDNEQYFLLTLANSSSASSNDVFTESFVDDLFWSALTPFSSVSKTFLKLEQ